MRPTFTRMPFITWLCKPHSVREGMMTFLHLINVSSPLCAIVLKISGYFTFPIVKSPKSNPAGPFDWAQWSPESTCLLWRCRVLTPRHPATSAVSSFQIWIVAWDLNLNLNKGSHFLLGNCPRSPLLLHSCLLVIDVKEHLQWLPNGVHLGTPCSVNHLSNPWQVSLPWLSLWCFHFLW